MSNSKLGRLERIASAVLEGELAKLERVSKELDEKKTQFENLKQTGFEQEISTGELLSQCEIPIVATQMSRWSEWRVRERKRLTQEIATISAKKETRLSAARTAFGRHETLGKLRLRANRQQSDTTRDTN